MNQSPTPLTPVTPRCPLFGQCGGCQYQDLPYDEQLRIKEQRVRELFLTTFPRMDPAVFEPMVPSPKQYHYRCRLDMKFLKTRSQACFMGFTPVTHRGVLEAAACPLALEPISDFLPELKRQAMARIPAKYRNANLVVKSGDDGRVCWGGIGRRSLRQDEADYLWTEVEGRRVYFSLDTFFQANLEILPAVMRRIRGLGVLHDGATFYDLYGGVGLFGICLADQVRQVVLVEENIYSVRVARFNAAYHALPAFEILSGRMEEVYSADRAGGAPRDQVAMIDPPRNGLSDAVARQLAQTRAFGSLLYLSCHPDSLIRDLRILVEAGWQIRRVIPFDFFPQTRHVETLVQLGRGDP